MGRQEFQNLYKEEKHTVAQDKELLWNLTFIEYSKIRNMSPKSISLNLTYGNGFKINSLKFKKMCFTFYSLYLLVR